jgi:hypothetical protein
MSHDGNRNRSRSVLDATIVPTVCIEGSINQPDFHNHLTALNEAVLVGLRAESDPIADHVVAARDVLRQLVSETMLSHAELTTIYTDLNRLLPVTDLTTDRRISWRDYCSSSAMGIARAPSPTDLLSLPSTKLEYTKWDPAHPALAHLVATHDALIRLPGYFPPALKQHLLAIAAAYHRYLHQALHVSSQAELDAMVTRAQSSQTLVGGLGMSLHTVLGTVATGHTIGGDNDDRSFVVTELPPNQRVPFSAIALWWLGKRLFNIPMHQLGFVVIADRQVRLVSADETGDKSEAIFLWHCCIKP